MRESKEKEEHSLLPLLPFLFSSFFSFSVYHNYKIRTIVLSLFLCLLCTRHNIDIPDRTAQVKTFFLQIYQDGTQESQREETSAECEAIASQHKEVDVRSDGPSSILPPSQSRRGVVKSDGSVSVATSSPSQSRRRVVKYDGSISVAASSHSQSRRGRGQPR